MGHELTYDMSERRLRSSCPAGHDDATSCRLTPALPAGVSAISGQHLLDARPHVCALEVGRGAVQSAVKYETTWSVGTPTGRW